MTGNKLSNLRLNARALAVAARFRPDVVISGHAVASPAAAVIQAITRTPMLQYLHADEARQRPRLLRFAVKRAAAVIAVSRHARDLALAAGCEPDRVRVIHPGVDAAPDRQEPQSERPTMITVARLQVDYKGHDTLIRSLPEIRRRIPDVHWFVVGDGDLRAHLEQLATDGGVRDAITFAGHVSEAERDRLLDSSHVFAMPSRMPGGGGGEGFGIVYLEAGAHGLPVVAGAVGGALDAVVDGETGLLVDPTDEAAVADAVVELLTDRELAERLGEAGAEQARRLTWRRHAKAVEDLIGDLAGEQR
jgi:phosphatidylinositol alpha-1,6-mannosyltransferase